MKNFIVDFLTLLANSVLVICLALMSFLLISNFYHYREVSYKYTTDLSANAGYNDYKKTMKRVDKKMKSVDYTNVNYGNTAKPIYEYYSGCVKALNDGTFANLDKKDGITAMDIYNANNEILKEYNNKCIFYIPYNITSMYSKIKPSVSFDGTYKNTSLKGDLIIDNAEYLTKSGMGNSSYGFSTETTRSSIYNKVSNELELTVDNYEMIASLLEDIADWYTSEFGGNN